MATVAIDNKDMEQFQKNLSLIAGQMNQRYLKAYSENIASRMSGQVRDRYKNSGPNDDGAGWKGIKLSSFMRRSTAQKTPKGRLSEHGKRIAGYAATLNLDAQLDPKKVPPFILSGGPSTQSQKAVTPMGDGYMVVVSPLLRNKKGELIADFAAGGGKGWQPKRAAFYRSAEDNKEIINIGLRMLDKMVKDMIK